MGDCPSCGRELPGQFPFCPYCGSAIEAAPARPAELERKVVTALFCDLVGSTAAAEGADPEDVRRRLGRFHQLVRARLEAFGGTVEKFAGDAALAVFGAPVAHEDDAERAVRAGLAILDALAAVNERDPALALHVRIGVNTGDSVVDLSASSGQGDAFVFGDVVNTAARLQSAAPIDAVVVGAATRRATERAVEYDELEQVAAKGKAEPLGVWRAVRARSSLGVDVMRQVASPMVGRDGELELLLAAFDRCCTEGRVEMVTVVGEPGVGKSRLVAELFARTDDRPELITWRQGRCLPYGEGITYWALGEIVKAQAGIDDADDSDVATAKLERILPAGPDRDRLLARLLPLLGLEGAAASPVDSHRAWRDLLAHVASSGPLVMVVEDVHWADDALLDFLEGVVAEAAAVPMLVVCTARPGLLERHPAWTEGAPRCATIRLDRLSDEDTSRLVSALLDQVQLPPGTQSAILDRAAGNPLYAEEFVRLLRDAEMLDEHGALRPGADVGVPDGIQALITARLDGLDPPAKAVLQAAAVVGKVFSAAEVAGALGDDPSGLDDVLTRLHRHEYVRAARRTSGDAALEYSFWHVLVRDVAYSGLSRTTRARLHASFADWLAARTDRPESVAEIAAHHAEQALALATALDDEALAARMQEGVRSQSLLAGQHLLGLDLAAAERHLARARELSPPDHPQAFLAAALHARALFGVSRFAECCEVAEPVWDAAAAQVSLLDSPDVFAALVDFRNASFLIGGDWDPDLLGLFRRYVASSPADTPGRVAVSAYLANHLVLSFDERLPLGVALAEEAVRDSRRLRCWSSMAEATAALGRAMLGDESAYLELLRETVRLRDTEAPTYAVLGGCWAISAADFWEGPVRALALYEDLLQFESPRNLDAAAAIACPVRTLVASGRLRDALGYITDRGWDAEVPANLGDDVLIASSLIGRPSAPAREACVGLLAMIAERPEESNVHEVLGDLPGFRVALASAALAEGDREAARDWMLGVRASELARLRNYAHSVSGAARAWLELGDVAALAELAAHVVRLTPFEQCNAGTVGALLLEAEGRHREAAEAFAAAAESWRAFGHALDEVYAVLGEGRNRAAYGDTRAAATLHRARSLASEMGAGALVAECDAALVQVEQGPS